MKSSHLSHEGEWKVQVDGCEWFGGGCDLTPAYLHECDAHAFHAFWRQFCALQPCSLPRTVFVAEAT